MILSRDNTSEDVHMDIIAKSLGLIPEKKINDSEINNLECPRCGKKSVTITFENTVWPIFCENLECFSMYDCNTKEEAVDTYNAIMKSSDEIQKVYKKHRLEDYPA